MDLTNDFQIFPGLDAFFEDAGKDVKAAAAGGSGGYGAAKVRPGDGETSPRWTDFMVMFIGKPWENGGYPPVSSNMAGWKMDHRNR